MTDPKEELAKLKEIEKKKRKEIEETKKKIDKINKTLDAEEEFQKKLLLEQIAQENKLTELEKITQEETKKEEPIDFLYNEVKEIYQKVESKGYLNNYDQQKIMDIHNNVDKYQSESEKLANKVSAIKRIGQYFSK